MIIKHMTITNSRGDSIKFGHHFKLIDDFELSGLDASVNYAESTSDGSHYQNTKLDNGSYTIPFFIDRKWGDANWIETKRAEAFRVMNPTTNPMRIDFTTKGGQELYLTANLEGTPKFGQVFEDDNPLWLKGLLQLSSGDPYFYGQAAKVVDIALWVGAFEFPLEIPAEGIEFGHRTESLIVNVLNQGQTRSGMTIRFKATGTVSSPMLLNVNTYESIKLNFSMKAGDEIEIKTYKGQRSITLFRDNQYVDIFRTIDFPNNSVFLQLEIGDNLFRYDADGGLGNLEVSMTFVERMLGV